MYPPLRVDVAFCVQVLPQNLGRLEAESRLPSVIAGDRNGCKLMRLHYAEANPRIFLDLPLQVLGKLFVALRRGCACC